MKARLLAITLVAVMVGFVACGGGGGGDDIKKSSNKEITQVKVGGQTYNKDAAGTTFSWHYPKSDPGEWTTEPTWPASLEITHTGKSITASAGATITPSDSKITLNTTSGAGVTITITAEDGTQKPFTIKATRDATL